MAFFYHKLRTLLYTIRPPVLIVNQHADESGNVYYNEFGYNVTKDGFNIRHEARNRRFIDYLAIGI